MIERNRARSLFNRSFAYWETNPEHSLSLLYEAQSIAKQLEDNCFLLSCDMWISNILIFYLNRPVEALKIAMQATVQARNPVYQNCNRYDRIRIFRVLLDAYLYCDPVGYEDSIREAIKYMEMELNPDHETVVLLQWSRAYLELALNNLDKALEEGFVYIERSANSAFRLADAYSILCEIRYQRNELAEILPLATIGAEYAMRHRGTQRWLLEFQAWQAFCLLRNGEPIRANLAYTQSSQTYNYLSAKPFPAYFDAICEYHELNGDPNQAKAVRDIQLKQVIESESPYAQTECRLRRSLLLARIGQDKDEEIRQAYEAAKLLQKPTAYLQKLKGI